MAFLSLCVIPEQGSLSLPQSLQAQGKLHFPLICLELALDKGGDISQSE